MGDRLTHLRHGRFRSLHLQRIAGSDCADIDRPPATVDPPIGPDAVDDPSAESNENFPSWAERVPLSEPVAEHGAQVAAVWSPSRLADPVGSARRVHEQLQHSGASAARTHAALEGVHELIGVD